MTIKIEASQRLSAATAVVSAVSGKDACKIIEKIFLDEGIKVKARLVDNDLILCKGKFDKESFEFGFTFLSEQKGKRKDFAFDFNWQPQFDLGDLYDAALPDWGDNTKKTAKEFSKASANLEKLRNVIDVQLESYTNFLSNMEAAMNKIANLVAANKENPNG